MSKQSPGEALTNNDKIYFHENRKQPESKIVQEDRLLLRFFKVKIYKNR